MNRKVKIAIYYVLMFIVMCTLIFIIEKKSDSDMAKSYESANYAGYEKYVSVPKNLEVLGRGEKTTFFGVIVDTITDQLLMVLFLIISTIPLCIYYSAKYIEKLDNETNQLIDISNKEYLENREKSKENVTLNHKALMNDGLLNYKQGIFLGMLSDHLKMKDIFLGTNSELNHAIIFEQDSNNTNYISKILKGLSYIGESIIVIDQNDTIYNETSDDMSSYGYDVVRIDFTDNKDKNIFKKNKGQVKINLLEYFSSPNEIISLANLIAKGNSYLTKMISALIFVVMGDIEIENPSMKDVYDLSCMSLDEIVNKINLIKDAYNIYNELILLDNKTKTIIKDEAREVLEIFNQDVFDFTKELDKKDYKLDLYEVKNQSRIIYVNLDELKAPYALSNVFSEAIFNVAKNAYLKDNKETLRKLYLINPELNMYPKYSHLPDRLKDASKYGLNFIIGLSNVKQFKDKYEYDVEKVIDSIDTKIFYAVRQYETTETLKNVLVKHNTNKIANIISSLDTNKCIICIKDHDYMVMNIEEPTGEKYDRYSYAQDDKEVIDKLKNKDVKVRVDYLDEFKKRFQKKNETQKEDEKEKALNMKVELTKEEKEYIASLLKEKQEQDEKRFNAAESYENKINYIEDEDEFADGDVDKPSVVTNSLSSLYDTNDLELNNHNNEDYYNKGYDSQKEIVDEREKEKAAQRIRETLSRQNKLRSEEDIDKSLDKLNQIQNNFEKIVEEEKVKTTHALYEQMKKLK